MSERVLIFFVLWQLLAVHWGEIISLYNCVSSDLSLSRERQLLSFRLVLFTILYAHPLILLINISKKRANWLPQSSHDIQITHWFQFDFLFQVSLTFFFISTTYRKINNEIVELNSAQRVDESLNWKLNHLFLFFFSRISSLNWTQFDYVTLEK